MDFHSREDVEKFERKVTGIFDALKKLRKQEDQILDQMIAMPDWQSIVRNKKMLDYLDRIQQMRTPLIAQLGDIIHQVRQSNRRPSRTNQMMQKEVEERYAELVEGNQMRRTIIDGIRSMIDASEDLTKVLEEVERMEDEEEK